MKLELTKQQIDSLILAMNASISQLGFSKSRHEKYLPDIDKDIEYIKFIKEKIDLITYFEYIGFTKYEMYTLISIASNYEDLHEQPQDTKVNSVVKVKHNILDIIKSPLPYIDIIFIRMEKQEMEQK